MRGNHWPETKIEKLKQLWAQGLSQEKCAELLHVTRNAIAGAVRRNKLPKRRTRVVKAWVAPRKREVIRPEDPPVFLALTFMELRPRSCRYPRTTNDVHLYCGQPRLDKSAYCSYCHSICYQPKVH